MPVFCNHFYIFTSETVHSLNNSQFYSTSEFILYEILVKSNRVNLNKSLALSKTDNDLDVTFKINKLTNGHKQATSIPQIIRYLLKVTRSQTPLGNMMKRTH